MIDELTKDEIKEKLVNFALELSSRCTGGFSFSDWSVETYQEAEELINELQILENQDIRKKLEIDNKQLQLNYEAVCRANQDLSAKVYSQKDDIEKLNQLIESLEKELKDAKQYIETHVFSDKLYEKNLVIANLIQKIVDEVKP